MALVCRTRSSVVVKGCRHRYLGGARSDYLPCIFRLFMLWSSDPARTLARPVPFAVPRIAR